MTLSINKVSGRCSICENFAVEKVMVEITDEQECRNYHCSAIADICISLCQGCLKKMIKTFEEV